MMSCAANSLIATLDNNLVKHMYSSSSTEEESVNMEYITFHPHQQSHYHKYPTSAYSQ